MSIFDPKGNQVTSEKGKEYKVGTHSITTPISTTDLLRSALQNSQQAIAQQTMIAAQANGKDDMEAKAMAMDAIGQVQSPFQFEPCAQAVFMMLSQYVEYQEKVILNLSSRLEKLDGQSCDIKPSFDEGEPPKDSN